MIMTFYVVFKKHFLIEQIQYIFTLIDLMIICDDETEHKLVFSLTCSV